METAAPATVAVLGHRAHTFTVEGHHYALVIVEGLEPGTCVPYTVEVDGEVVWPEAASTLPPCVIRTPAPGAPVTILAGSCRAAAPHEPPWSLESALDPEGRGVDALWAHARRMLPLPIDEWPTLLVLGGDQIYADDSSPFTKERIEACRPESSDLPTEIVATFEEYCWLYREAWSPPLERWLLSVVPSAMIFDDHDMIDDWNISGSWVRDIRREPWWDDHVVGGMMSYWIHQHLGNLSPAELRRQGMLDRFAELDDATDELRDWARRSESSTPLAGGYRFGHTRRVGDVEVIVIDCRNGRVLDDERRMVDDDEWAEIVSHASSTDAAHLLLVTSLPVFLPDGLHDLHVWNERVCDRKWGRRLARTGERIRRGLDLEDWPAFAVSYAAFVDLVSSRARADDAPSTIVVLSGDIHFSYAAVVPVAAARSRVHQLVSSPIRNALIPHERGVMRFALTAAGRRIGGLLRRSVRAPRTAPGIDIEAGPFFANGMCVLTYRGDKAVAVFEQAVPGDDGSGELHEVARLEL